MLVMLEKKVFRERSEGKRLKSVLASVTGAKKGEG